MNQKYVLWRVEVRWKKFCEFTTLNTAHVAISVFETKNMANRIKRLFWMAWPGELWPSCDESDVWQWLKYKNILNDSNVAPRDPKTDIFLQ